MGFVHEKVDTIWFPLVGVGFGFLMIAYLVWKVLTAPKGDEEVERIGRLIRQGATAFMWTETKILLIVVAVLAVIIGVVTWSEEKSGELVSYLLGVMCSSTSGFVGMYIGTRANTRTCEAAKVGLLPALRIALNSGAVMSFMVVTLSLLGLVVCWMAYNHIALSAFGFGASTIALFYRVAGGIFTKSSDVGADLVGKNEEGLPEDDPRNAASIADNVGDQVGDIAGLGSDLFESFVGSMVAGCALGLSDFNDDIDNPHDYRGVAYTFYIGFAGIIASIIGCFSVRVSKNAEASQAVLLKALRIGTAVTSILITILALIGGYVIFDDDPKEAWKLFGCVTIGLFVGVLIGLWTEYYTSYEYKPTLELAKSGTYGDALVVINGTSLGLMSTLFPIIGITVAILSTYTLHGVFGTAIAAIGMLSTLGFTLATDAYGPISDNAGGIAEMSQQPPKVRELTEELDALGNTNAALGKAFSVASATITALSLIEAYKQHAHVEQINVVNASTLAGLLIGGLLPCIFASLTMSAVFKGAAEVINEVRRQFKYIPGLLEGTAECDPQTCVHQCTITSLKEMIVPGILMIFSPITVGYLLGSEALGGLLMGTTLVASLLGIYMNNAGGAWDNAKKACETGVLGEDIGKGSDEHKALVTGDTVGDPFKDVSGPSLNVLSKLMAHLSLMFGAQFQYGWARWRIGLILSIVFLVIIVVYYIILSKTKKNIVIINKKKKKLDSDEDNDQQLEPLNKDDLGSSSDERSKKDTSNDDSSDN
ncbi:k(+)-insensitive pyrophosphate-energized proton pump [Anaeramoeba flamelloides]|uniref:H(+)-exporting diphosphatase n=1 Tax=Anaeramoeba flamelloides TaxID=1746091 RepID=A0ABQ8YJM5_9EUKA|nr:k(+)-insensitive pyrophosphate-energized proton pump [Anaeramoeba flamelloides]